MSGAVSRLSRPRISLEQALVWLDQRANEEHFSLSDVWGLLTSVEIMKEVRHKHVGGKMKVGGNLRGTIPVQIYNYILLPLSCGAIVFIYLFWYELPGFGNISAPL